MNIRVKKFSSGLFFDSMKHFKNNLSNLVSTELITLCSSVDLNEYLSLKPVNYKSKLPDMRKIGVIDYDRPRDNIYELTEEGHILYKTLNKYKNKFDYPTDLSKNVRTIRPSDLIDILTDNELKLFRENILKLLLSYFDTADFIRPYLLLLKTLENNNIKVLDNATLYNILAQPKLNILNNYIDPLAFKNLSNKLKEELIRPTSYIRNFLQTSMIIDKESRIIYNKEEVNSIILDLEEIDIESLLEPKITPKTNIRSTKLQKQFRDEVLENFNYNCAITGEPIIIKRNDLNDIIILEAAHIIPFSEGGSFSYTNGISLTPELHKLFDLGLFTFKNINESYLEVIVTNSKSVKDNGLLKRINGKKVNLSNLSKGMPDETAIEYRSDKII